LAEEIKIQIKDYQGIKKASIEAVAGLTAIIGKSNAGKTAIIRAIEDLINNSMGDSEVRIGTDRAVVAVKSKENVVKMIREPGSNFKTSYVINGETIQKVGRTKIDEVDLLGLSPVNDLNLNFIRQEDLPFLIFENPYRIYEFMSQSKSILLLNTSKKVKEEKKTVDGEIKTKEGQCTYIKNEYEKIRESVLNYPDIKEMKEIEEYLDKIQGRLQDLEAQKDIYLEGIERKERLSKDIERIGKRVEVLSVVKPEFAYQCDLWMRDTQGRTVKLADIAQAKEDVKTDIESMRYVGSLSSLLIDVREQTDLGGIIKAKTAYKDIAEAKRKLAGILNSPLITKGIPNMDYVKGQIHNFERLGDLLKAKKKYDLNYEQKEDVQSKIVYVSSQIDKAKAELEKYKVCPTCGKPLEIV